MRYMTGENIPDFDFSCNLIFQDGTQEETQKYKLHDLKNYFENLFPVRYGIT